MEAGGMKRITAPLALGSGLALALAFTFLALVRAQDEPPPNPEMQRQEIINIERETAHAIQLHNGTFFRRVYSDDFHGVLSFGLPVDKQDWIRVIELPTVDYVSFIASETNVRLYKDLAVASSLWSWRANLKNQKIYSQMRVLHIYINGPRGWKVVAGQLTALPPYVHQVL
jgi:hypothetical protein